MPYMTYNVVQEKEQRFRFVAKFFQVLNQRLGTNFKNLPNILSVIYHENSVPPNTELVFTALI
jgi:hypothetical protein